MSNLTPEDVDLKLTSVHEKLNEEDMRLWEGLEDEKISRIAGDEANKKFTLQVQNENQGTESRLSTEVIHRSEGDLVNVGSLNALAQAMSEYRIKTDLELANEAIARQQLGVELDTKINNFVASWDHTTMSLYSAIQAVQDDVNNKHYNMDKRIRKYEDMLQDITTDSIQITMDNGEINMGAWTILSQAREWDLEIIGMFKDYKVTTDKTIDEAIKDIENKIPIPEEIINQAIEQLSQAPIIKELEKEIGGLEVTIDGVTKTMMEHRIDTQNQLVNMSKELGDQVKAETDARAQALKDESATRIEELRKETATRQEQIKLLDDGLTVEIQERVDGDNHAYELIENLKVSSETDLANVYQAIKVNTDGISANASKIEQLDAQLTIVDGKADTAIVNAATAQSTANTAVEANKATASRVDSVEASITDINAELQEKVDVIAYNELKATVERVDGTTTANSNSITVLQGDMQTANGIIGGHTTAISNLQSTQTAQGDSINQLVSQTTVLEATVKNIGGENLIPNSRFYDVVGWSSNGGSFNIITKTNSPTFVFPDNETACIQIITNTANGGLYRLADASLKKDEDLTCSIWARGDVGGEVLWLGAEGIGSTIPNVNKFTLTTEWKRYWWTGKRAKDGPFNMTVYTGIAGTIYVNRVQLERGAVPTRWRPAVQDTVDGLNANAKATSDLKVQVDKQDGDIKVLSENTIKLDAKVDGLRANGSNLLRKSNVEAVWNGDAVKYPHCAYNMSEPWIEGETYTLTWCITHKQSATATGQSSLGAYAGGGIQSVDDQRETGVRKIYVKQFVKSSANVNVPVMHFYHFNWSNDLKATATIHWAVLTRGASIGVSSWEACDADLIDGINNSASAEALSNLRAEVNVIDGKVTSTANDLTILKGTVDKNQADLISNYYTKVQANDAMAVQINSLTANISKSGRNYVRNTSFKRQGAYWTFQDLLSQKISGVVTISFDLEELSGTPQGGGVGFNATGDGGNGGFKYVWYPTMSTGHKTWTGTVDSEAFTNFGIYTNTSCRISNVKLEYGNIETAWQPAPEDIEVGGRNFIKNSEFKKEFQFWSNYNAAAPRTVEYNMEGRTIKYAFISVPNNTTVGGLHIKPADTPYTAKRGDTMTVSFYARGNGRIRIGFDYAFDNTIVLDGTFRRYSRTFRRDRSDNIIFYTDGATYIDLALPKVELGNVGTAWTPAPEDIESDLLANASATSTLTTKVTDIDGRVTSQASQIVTLTSTVSSLPVSGGNLLMNSDFSSKNKEYWGTTAYNEAYEADLLLGGDYGYYQIKAGLSNTMMVHSLQGNTTGTSAYTELYQRVSVEVGKTYQISAYVGIHRNTTQLFSYFYDKDGKYVGNTYGVQPGTSSATDNGSTQQGGPTLGEWRRLYQTVKVPAGAAYMTLHLRKNAGDGTYLFVTRAQLVEVPENTKALVPWSDTPTQNTAAIQVTNEVVDGVKAVSTTSVNNNGFISGFGLISQLVNGVVTSAFGVDADYFYVGKSMANAKKPFMVLTSPQTIGGVTYPAGVWMDVAVIANATIGTAHIADASITNAKIKDLDASKITSGFIDAGRIRIGAGTQYETGYDPTKISIGGVNFFGSNNNIDGYNVSVISRTHTLTGNTLNCGIANGAARTLRINGVLPENNVWYTFSGYAKGNQGVAASFRADIGDAGSTTFTAPADGSWLFFSVTAFKGVITNTHNFCDIEPLDWLNYEFKDIKIEKGNKATAWSASNYDLNRGVAAATDTANVANQKVTNWARAENVTYIDGRKIYTGSIYADQISSGAVTADKLYSNTVSGMFANFGRFETSVAGKGKTVISGTDYTVYDQSGQERIFLGIR